MARIASSLRNIKKLGRFAAETGASMVEYTLLLALIAVVAITALTFLGNSAKTSLCDTGKAIAKSADCATPAP